MGIHWTLNSVKSFWALMEYLEKTWPRLGRKSRTSLSLSKQTLHVPYSICFEFSSSMHNTLSFSACSFPCRYPTGVLCFVLGRLALLKERQTHTGSYALPLILTGVPPRAPRTAHLVTIHTYNNPVQCSVIIKLFLQMLFVTRVFQDSWPTGIMTALQNPKH